MDAIAERLAFYGVRFVVDLQLQADPATANISRAFGVIVSQLCGRLDRKIRASSKRVVAFERKLLPALIGPFADRSQAGPITLSKCPRSLSWKLPSEPRCGERLLRVESSHSLALNVAFEVGAERTAEEQT